MSVLKWVVLTYGLIMFVMMVVIPFVVRRHPHAQELDAWDRNVITALMLLTTVAWPLFPLLPMVLNRIADLLEREAAKRRTSV